MHWDILTRAQQKVWAKLAGAKVPEGFYLAGGTAIALRLGHRESEDLDFFSEKPFSKEVIIATASGVSSVQVEQIGEGTLYLTVDHIRVSFLSYPYPLIAPAQEWNDIVVADLVDIVPMKLIALAQRGTKKDFFDIDALINSGWPLEAMFETMERKFANVRYNKMHILKSVTFFEDAEGDEQPRSLTGATWSEVKERIRSKVAEFTFR